MTDSVFTEAPQASLLETLVGEGKKYKDVEELAKAYNHADAFIKTTTKENQELREELNVRLDTEEVLRRARQDQNPAPQLEPKTQTPATATPLTNEDLAARIREVTQAERVRETAQSNVSTVANKLIEQFGDDTKANEFVKNKAAELGIDVKGLQDLAARSPSAFFNAIGLTATPKTPTTSPARSDVSTEAFRNNNGTARPGTYAYYEDLRKTNPKVYFSQNVQLQMHKDAMAADARGEDF